MHKHDIVLTMSDKTDMQSDRIYHHQTDDVVVEIQEVHRRHLEICPTSSPFRCLPEVGSSNVSTMQVHAMDH